MIPPRYKKIKTASGGFGHVDICQDTILQRKVVIKRVLDIGDLPRLIDEVVALQNAKSKYVVNILDVLISDDGGNISIVEEYLPGSDLVDKKLHEADSKARYQILYQVARALEDIHRLNIVHRDIKPMNMKFDDNGIVKLFDFGLAKIEENATTMTVIGTPGFMAPELYVVPAIIKPAVDIYAFGVLAYVLATGKLPPSSPSAWPNPPVALPPGTGRAVLKCDHDSIADLIDRCLDLDPNKRPTAVEIVAALQRELLYGRRKAILVSGATVLTLNAIGKHVTATHRTHAATFLYDGYDFAITSVTGDVFVNNVDAVPGMILDGSHVITLSASGRRMFFTFDVNRPEVDA
ncbi:serine/threonine-protein kinase [Cupriavidus campinensis]|uniref:Serine/threonine-protein kinase n=1 Tax=Cupriavidus campinensis TaxID=151783 RepID=A0AAE9I0P7_9BURK|nr:protein kinase [Cupriavidus campinensis]URF03832.1 serine/threonine-protein kinase [Cupriavidus campinensis]